MEDETEETNTETENSTPPVTHHNYDDAPVKQLIHDLNTKVEELTETVNTIVAGNGERDSTPVKKPWTHWGSK